MPLVPRWLPLLLLATASHAGTGADKTAPPQTYDFEVFPNNNSYKLHAELVDWGTAWQICREESAYLAIVNDEEEALILKGIFARIGESVSKYCLIGFHDLFVEGHYVTEFDEDLTDTGYLVWAPGEPNNSLNEDCGSMTHSAWFNDIDCAKKAVFVCEKEKEQT